MGAKCDLNPRLKMIDGVSSGEELVLNTTDLIYNPRLDEIMCLHRLLSAKGYIYLKVLLKQGYLRPL